MSNPIVTKEVLSSLRTKKAIAMQVLFLAVVTGLVWLLWPAGGLQDPGGKQAERLLSVLAIGQLVLIALFAPAFTAASLTLERERNTFESLFSTPLRPWEIAVGKMLGSLTFLLLMVICGIPALAVPFLLGGVPGTRVLAVVGLLLLTAVYLGMIGLLVSSISHRSYRSIIITYAILLVVCFLAATPAWPISRGMITRGGPAWQAVWHTVASMSPLEAMLSVVWPNNEWVQGSTLMPDFWQVYVLIAAGVIVVTTVVLLSKLHRPIAPPRPREKLRVIERDGKLTARSVMFLVDPRKRKRMIRWWQNPVLIKEFRSRPMLQAQWLLRAVAICLIVSVLLMFLVSLSVQAFVAESGRMIPMMAGAVAALMTVLVILIGPAIAGGAICSDRESGVWDLMRTTRIPSWRIASGKFQSTIIPIALLVLAMAPALVILLYFSTDLLPNVLAILQVVGVTILFVSVVGMFFSSVFSRTSAATAATYAVVVTMGLVTLLVLLGQQYFSQRFVRYVFIFNPVAAALDAAGYASMQEMGLRLPFMRIIGLVTAALFVVTVVRVFQLRRHD